MLAIYCRISREINGSTSIETQLKLGKEFAKNMNLEFKSYIDSNISGGAKTEDRPGFNDMWNDIIEGTIDAVYVYNQDRAERDEMTWFTLAQLVIENNIKFYENGQLIDLNNPDVFMLHGVKTVLNSHFRRITSKKIKNKLRVNAQENKAHGILPYGYMKGEDGKIVLNDVEVEVVKQIFKLSLKGSGIQTIANYLNKNNIPTKYSGLPGTLSIRNKYTGKVTTKEKSSIKWSSKTVHDILKNTWYKGLRKFGGINYDISDLAIFEDSYWNVVNQNLISNKNHSGPKTKYKYLLKGLIRCAKCDRNFYGRTRQNKKDNFYMCSSKRLAETNCGNRSINIDVIDDFIWSRFFVGDVLKNKVIHYFNDAKENNLVERVKEEVKALQEQLEGLRTERSHAIKLIIKNVITEEDFLEERKTIDNRIESLKISIHDKSYQLDRLIELESNRSELLKDFKNLKETTSFNDKQEIISKYIKNIVISDEFSDIRTYTVEIYFNLDLEDEVYLIGYNYDYAIEYFESIIIPISERFKRLDESDLNLLGKFLSNDLKTIMKEKSK